MNWLSLISIFATPIGGLINKGLTAGSAAFIGWATAKGLPATDAATLASAGVLAVSTIISAVSRSQGVVIPMVNDAENGVKVVAASVTAPTVNSPLK